MHIDKDPGKAQAEAGPDGEEETREESLQWLLDMDLSEPEESLFKVEAGEYETPGLTAFEAEVAGRPLVRGNASSDDLDSYVAEEIVISSESSRSDIYGVNHRADVDNGSIYSDDEVMAIDYSRREMNASGAGSAVEDGTDILGLSGDDDMGEKFLSIKRVRRGGTEPEAAEAAKPEEPAVDAQDEDEAPIQLSEAPVPSRIADPAADTVANDAPEEREEIASVLDYVASMPQPAGEEAFDQYLVAGHELPDDAADPEELVAGDLDGVVSLDLSETIEIDYHEDFRSERFDKDPVAEVAAVIGPVMDEIGQYLAQRAEAMGFEPNSVDVAVMFGADEASIKQCYAEGYEPVRSICPQLPEALVPLSEAAQEALYVRLFHVETQENCNDLFSEDFGFGPVTTSDKSVEAIEAQPATGESEDVAGFGEDPFGADVAIDFGAVVERTGGEDPGMPDDPAIEAGQAEDEGEGIETVAGFGEDLFGDDFADEFDAGVAQAGSDSVDIDSAFALLSQPEGGDNDICELEEQDFAEPEQEQPSRPAQDERDALLVAANDTAAGEPGTSVESDAAVPFAESGPNWCIPEGIDFNYTSQSNGEIFADFLDAFIEEGSTEVERLEDLIGEWEKDVAAEAVLAEVGRTLHTIKGIAKGVGLHRFGTLVHNFETLLEAMPKPEAGGAQSYFRIVNAWLDAVVRGIEFVTDSRVDIASELPVVATGEAGQEPGDESPQGDEVAAQQAPSEPAPARTARSASERKQDQQLADEGAKVLAAQQSVRITSEKLDHLLNLASQVQQLGVRASQNTARSKRSSAELQARLASVRTHIGKIADRSLLNINARGGRSSADMDALEMDQYSELQEAASILREGVEDLADLIDVVSRQNANVEALLKQQSSVISSIHSSIQAARVVPVSRLMPGLRRIVRTVSTDLDKAVSFKVLNETGALDRDHYSRLQVALEHMVRNALDHGIESPEERLAAGKPTGGRITIEVRKSGGDYVIRLSDDGRGIDPDAIRESAFEKGLDINADDLTDDEAVRLIFHKGFSTANSLSEISGRGVGMDIVLTELQQIGGDIQVQSAVGLGTSFEVRIPSSVTVNGALLVSAAEDSYAIPLNGLIAVEQVPVDTFFRAVEEGEVLLLSDLECEPAYLGTLCQGMGLPDRDAWDGFIPVIIAGSEERYMAIAIDNLEEALELVVRSLGSQFSTVPGVAGAATTTDGEAIVALDLNLLVESAGGDGITAVAMSKSEDSRLLALVVDDSRTQRMVATSQLDTVGVETVTAENGLVAIDLLNSTHRLPDVVLLDVEMPVKDGIETLREIRKSRRYGHLPVIMVTSRTGAKHRALAKEAGCNGYMGKPFNFPGLIEQINELTGHELQLS